MCVPEVYQERRRFSQSRTANTSTISASRPIHTTGTLPAWAASAPVSEFAGALEAPEEASDEASDWDAPDEPETEKSETSEASDEEADEAEETGLDEALPPDVPVPEALLSAPVLSLPPGAGAAATVKVAVVCPFSYTKVRVWAPTARLLR